MGDIALHGPELKKLVKLAKKRDLNFAYCPGNDPKEDVFVLDRKKKPEVIGRVARGEGTGTKAAIGTAHVKGRVMMLTCLKEVPQAAKKLKKFLKFEKVPMNIIIMDKDGNVLEEDIEDLPEDPEWDSDDDNNDDTDEDSNAVAESEEEDPKQQGSDNNVDAQRFKKLKARAAALQGGIAALADPYKSAMLKAFKPAVGVLQSGDLDAADEALTNLEQAFSQMPGASSNNNPDDLDPLRQQAEALKQRIDALGDAEGASRLLAAHGMLANQIEAGDVKKANGIAKKLLDAIARVEAQSADRNALGQEDDDTNEDTDALDVDKVRQDWIKTRNGLTAEMTKLQDAIVATCDETEFPNIAKEANRLFTYLEKLDGRLEEALEALVQEPDVNKRKKLKADAAKVMTDYQAELNNEFFKSVDGNNGFKPVKVRRAAMESLGKVRTALSEAA